MGREVRRVPANWQHPKNENGHYIPLLGWSFKKRLAEYTEEKAQWENGFRKHWKDGFIPKDASELKMSFREWHGTKPVKKDFMPEWPEEEKTHFMMYEDTTEGTPISPAFETPEELAHWLAYNKASAFGNMTASYEAWLSTINRGWAPSAVMNTNDCILKSGVEGL